jgi:hypothetical protein
MPSFSFPLRSLLNYPSISHLSPIQ